MLCVTSSRTQRTVIEVITISDAILGDIVCRNQLKAVALADYLPFSDKQHLSYDGCLEVREEIIRTVLCCIVY